MIADVKPRPRSVAVCLAVLLAAALVAGCGSSSGGSGPSTSTGSAVSLPAPGATRVFAVDRVGRHSTRTVTLLAVSSVGADIHETIRSAEPSRPTFTGVYVKHADGSVADPTLTSRLAGGVTTSVPGFVVPSTKTLLSGKVVHENLTITLSSKGHVVHIPDTVSVNGAKTESAHVPAGTFQAIPVTVIQDYDVEGRDTTVESTSDLVPVFGTVRIVVVATQGAASQRTTEVLVRYRGGSGVDVQV